MRFLGPELPEKYHALLAEIAFSKEVEVEKTIEEQHKDVFTDCPTAAWQCVEGHKDQFVKYMLSGPQTTAMMHTTTAVTMINGGVKENVLPPMASALVNFRILQGDTVQSVVDYVKRIINDSRVEVTPDTGRSIDPSPVSDPYGKNTR